MDAIGGFVEFFYYSSTELDGNAAWGQSFEYSDKVHNLKFDGGNVRAVRAF